MSAVTLTDFLNYVRPVDLTMEQAVAVRQTLDSLQGDVEAYLGRPIEVRSFTDTYDWTGGDDFLVLRNSPVAGVQMITAETITSGGTVSDTLEVDFYTVTNWGIAGLATIPATYPYLLVVTYTAGLDTSNPRYKGIKSVILRAARRWYHQDVSNYWQQTAGGVISKFATDGGYSVMFGLAKPLPPVGEFEPGELDAIKRFRRRGAR